MLGRSPSGEIGMEVFLMHGRSSALVLVLLAASCVASSGQDPRQVVQQAVETELAADKADHSLWMFLDVDRKPNLTVQQWVAETSKGDLKRVVDENGHALSQDQQRARMDGYIRNPAAQARQRKSSQHDDRQARQMLSMLPQAFVWTQRATQNGKTILHFTPDPHFHAPSYQARVFAAMQGDMTVNDAQHRIVSLKGKLARAVKFGDGLLGGLRAGGTFDVERREIAQGEWQIVETHVHIGGRILVFKSIADQEDDVKSKFKELPAALSLDQAEKTLLQQGE
jgi:hypothetical protein